MSQFKKKLTAFSAMLAFLTMSSASTFALSTSDVINHTNNVGISGNDTRIDVEMTKDAGKGAVSQVDWQNFVLNSNQHLNFGFSNISQTIINRVLGGKEAQILGTITDSCTNGIGCGYDNTGKVILINPAGVLFGSGSAVDLNSFTVSTYDFTGAKNLKNMTAEEINAYTTNVLGKFNPLTTGTGSITFDSNNIQAFKDAGIDMDKFVGNTHVILAGTKFDNIEADGRNENKSIAIVSDNIRYKDSLLKTGENLNYSAAGQNWSTSNVKLITADGVTFGYLVNGYAADADVAKDTKTNVVRNIGGLTADDEAKIKDLEDKGLTNSKLTNNASQITSNTVDIINSSNAAGSNVKIANTYVKGTKLLNTVDGYLVIEGENVGTEENGRVFIKGNHDVTVDNSRLQTVNTEYNGADTTNAYGGEVVVNAGKNLTVNNSLVSTAGAKTGETSANVTLAAAGNATIKDTRIVAEGDIKVNGKLGVDVNNSLMEATAALDSTRAQNITIESEGNINSHNLVAQAKDKISFKSAKNGELSGNVNISGDVDSEKGNKSLIIARNKLSIQGKNTKIDNATVAYKDIKFYNDDTTGKNNVTVANGTNFAPLVVEDGKITGVSADVNLETNGDFTMDNATMQAGKFALSYTRNSDNTLYDDGTAQAIKYNTRTAGFTPDNLTVKSTEGNVIAKNNTNVSANKNINLTADKGNVDINSSTFKTTDENINITASKGSVNIKDNSAANAGKDLNIIANNTITFGAQSAANINIDNTSDLSAGSNMNVVSLAGDINAEKTTMPTLKYGERLTFNAANNNNFTSEDSLKAVNVDFVAGNENNITTKGDIQFVNSSLKAPKNNITTTEAGGDVIMNNLTIKQATTNAKDTVTKISAKGNVTTKDVTGTAEADANASVKTFPQSVNFEGVVTDKSTKDTVLDINQTKLIINTKIDKTTPKNNDQGSITIQVKNADNKDAGLDLVAENDSWDEQIDKGEGPEVHLTTADGKVSITNIDTDKLTLTKGDKFIAATDAPNGTPTIRVKDQGGFNMDPNEGYDPEPDGFTYDKTINSQEIDRQEERIWDEEKGEYIISTNDIETVYGKDYVDKVTVTTRDTEHEIHFGEDGEQEFKLIYDKTDVKITETPGTITWSEACEENPVLPSQRVTNADSYINIIKLPREQVEISKTSKVSDNTVDQTSSVMSAAAKVDLEKAAEATYTNTDDEEEK